MSNNNFYSDPAAMLAAMGAGQPGGLPMPKIVTAAQVKKQAAPQRKRIFENAELLRAILDRHEQSIHKRWSKKTKEQRRKILQAAWGSPMSATHRPDFQALYREGPLDGVARTVHRDAYVWPYVNEEDLSTPKLLLILLRSRARRPPSEFAAADLEAMHLGRTSKAIVPDFLNEYIMVFVGKNSAESYGELLHWDEHPDGFNWMHTRKAPLPGEGLLILEAQDRLMAFLVACVKAILHDMPDETTLLAAEVQPEPLLTSDALGDSLSWSSLAAEAPYRPPASLNFGALEILLAARRDAAADHIWALREDPTYFADRMILSKDHRQETLLDPKGERHALFTCNREDILWQRVLGSEVFGAYTTYEIFAELHAQAVRLKSLQAASQFKAEDDLPGPYLDAILKFRHYLTQAAKGPLALLKIAFVASPPARKYFTRAPVSSATDTRLFVQQKPAARLEKAESKLLWLLKSLWEDGQNLFLMKMTNVVDELQRLIDAEDVAKAFVSSYIAEIISDLATFCECLRQLENYQPWANGFEEQFVDKGNEIKAEFARRTRPLAQLESAVSQSSSLMTQYGIPNERRFHHPFEKRRTRENTEQMRLAEKNLDEFWSKLDRAMTKELQILEVRSILAEPRALQRTSPWVEPGSAASSKTADQTDTLLQPFSDLYLDLQSRTEKTLLRDNKIKPRGKDKTRGTARVPTSDLGADVEIAGATSTPILQVDARALKAFKIMFFTPSQNASPGELSWIDFLHAMSATGFVAKKLYGSVWQFSPTRLDVERSIHFHEPHPNGKIPFRTARLFGRRLNRAYGWEIETFALADVHRHDK